MPDGIPLRLDPATESYRESLLAAFLDADSGVPVVVSQLGSYPDVVLPDGCSTGTAPHIRISVGGTVSYYSDGPEVRTFDKVYVFALGRYVNGRRRSLTVWEDLGAGATPDWQHWVEKGLSHTPDAATALATIDATFDAAEARIGVIWRYGPLDRAAYEAACADCGVPAAPDAQCSTWGAYSFPEYTADQVVEYSLRQRRAARIKQEQQQPDVRDIHPRREVAKTGDIWEECPNCGREPVFMPLMVCERCWPAPPAS